MFPIPSLDRSPCSVCTYIVLTYHMYLRAIQACMYVLYMYVLCMSQMHHIIMHSGEWMPAKDFSVLLYHIYNTERESIDLTLGFTAWELVSHSWFLLFHISYV